MVRCLFLPGLTCPEPSQPGRVLFSCFQCGQATWKLWAQVTDVEIEEVHNVVHQLLCTAYAAHPVAILSHGIERLDHKVREKELAQDYVCSS